MSLRKPMICAPRIDSFWFSKFAPSGAEIRARFARIEERLRHMETCVASSEYELRRELRKLET